MLPLRRRWKHKDKSLHPCFHSCQRVRTGRTSHLSLGFASEHVVRVFEGSFQSRARAALQRPLLAEVDMQVSGGKAGGVHPRVAIEHSVVRAPDSVLVRIKTDR